MVLDQSVICPVVIGRENDLQLLDRMIKQSKQGSGQIARISGEAGIGKSRLVKEAKARAPEGTLLHGEFDVERVVQHVGEIDRLAVVLPVPHGEIASDRDAYMSWL